MSFYLGDVVTIQAHWRKTSAFIDEDKLDLNKIHEIEDEKGFVKVVDECVPWVEVHRFYRHEREESGFICGIRYKNTKQVLQIGRDNPYHGGYEDGIFCEDSTREKMYMVAVNMNTIRYVSESDMERVELHG